jgi:hypothetical protein
MPGEKPWPVHWDEQVRLANGVLAFWGGFGQIVFAS